MVRTAIKTLNTSKIFLALSKDQSRNFSINLYRPNDSSISFKRSVFCYGLPVTIFEIIKQFCNMGFTGFTNYLKILLNVQIVSSILIKMNLFFFHEWPNCLMYAYFLILNEYFSFG